MLGIGSGAVYSALALGLVLTYRGSGLINFAHGATAMYLAYAYVELRSEGDLVFPWLGVKSRFNLGDEMEFWPAMFVTILLSAFIGLIMHTLIFRPLRNAPPLAKTVASVGVLVALQGIVVIKFGTSSKTIPGVLPSEPVTFWDITIGKDRLYLAALAVGAAIALALLFRFTNFGLATRAAAENEKGAALLGYSPQGLAAVNWVLATVLAGIAGVLVGPITTLDPTTYTLLVIPALSAALVARFTSFTVACAVGLALGMLQSEILNLQSTYSWWPETGTRDALPFAVIVIALVLLGKRLPTRDTIREGRLPAALRTEHLGIVSVVSVAVGFVLLFTLSIAYRGPFIASMNAAVIALSIVVLTGFVGQISLAQMAYAGAAGFTLAKLATDADIPFPIAPILAAGVAAVLGLLVGLPSLRVRGINLAIVSLGLSVAVVEVWFKNPDWTGGFDGSSVPEPSIFGIDLGTGNDRSLGIVSLVALTLVALSVSALRRSATGRQMLAVRANERAAAAAGINPATTKLVAFAISGFIAGIGGCLLGYQQTELSFSTFGVLISVTFLALAYLGGIASVSGAMVAGSLASGGIVFFFAQEQFEWGKYQQVFSGIGVIVVAVLFNEGIAGIGPVMNRRVKALWDGGWPPSPPKFPPPFATKFVEDTKRRFQALPLRRAGNGTRVPDQDRTEETAVNEGSRKEMAGGRTTGDH